MIPSVAPATPSPGEAELYELFRDAADTESWIVLHSFDLPRHVDRIAGEADFVVIVPGKGVLVLEVKAVNSVRREGGLWFMGRAEKGDPRGPFKQAAGAMHSLRGVVASRQPGLRDILFWSAVVFPYLVFSDRSPEWHEWQVIDAASLRRGGLRAACLAVLDRARSYLAGRAGVKWFRPADPRPTLIEADALAATLRGDFEVFESPKSRLRRLDDEVLRYTQEQYGALDAMADNRRVVFDGAAGTGKTMLAMEATRRASLLGGRVLLVCFNRPLGRWLGMEFEGNPRVHAGTLHSYLLAETGLTPSDEPDFWSSTLPAAAVDLVLGDEIAPFDALVIDEAQDLLREPYLDFFDVALRGGLRGGRWLMFGDLANQRIYRATTLDVDGLLSRYRSLAPRFVLTENCRNTPRIATYAGILGGVPATFRKVRRPDNGKNPQTLFYNSEQEQQSALVSTLEAFAADGLVDDAVAILSAKADPQCASCLERTRWRGRRTSVDRMDSGRIRCGTIHSFKGLEAAAVVLTDIEAFDENHMDLFYVGATRALDRVTVLAHERTRPALTNALLRVGASDAS